jgi:hypothetical protein
MIGEPGANCRDLAIWQQRHDPSPCGILQMKRQLPGYFKILNVYGRALVSRQYGSVELLFRAGVDPIA